MEKLMELLETKTSLVMHVALTTTLCILFALGFIASTVLYGFNAQFWSKEAPLNSTSQRNGKQLAVLGFMLATFFLIVFLLTLSAGNQSGHIVPSLPQPKKSKA